MKLAVVSGKKKAPYCLVLYGVPGIGKSTLANKAPKPLFIDLEGGLSQIDCARVPVVDGQDHTRIMEWKSPTPGMRGFIEALTDAFKAEDYQTVVVDTITEAEVLLVRYILESSELNPRRYGSLTDFGYNKGFQMLGEQWSNFMRYVGRLMAATGKNVIFVGHSQIARVEEPGLEPYDRFDLNIHKQCKPHLVNFADGIFFARSELVVRDKETGTKKQAVSSGKRFLFCTEKPNWLAKNRFGLPEKIEMNPDVFKYLDQFNSQSHSQE
jgi:hypothetical protein